MLYCDTSAYLFSTTPIKDRTFPLLIYNFPNTSMVTKKNALFFTYCLAYTSLLHKPCLPPIIHNIPSITLHKSLRKSIKTQYLTKFTYLLRKTHIHHTMWRKSEKCMAAWLHHISTKSIKVPVRLALPMYHRLTTLEASTHPTKHLFIQKYHTVIFPPIRPS